MLNFDVIKFFGINTRIGKVFRVLPVRWKFSVRDILVLLIVEVFFMRV